MIKELKNYILSNFRTIFLFEGVKNKKRLNYKDFKLIKFKKYQSIKDKNVFFLLNADKKKRFQNKNCFFVLYFKKKVVSSGWMHEGTKWNLLEIDKEIDIKNKILLYDFFTSKKFRNRGFYSKILKLIKNLDTNKKFWIYCLANNHSSKKGIEKSNFNLIKKIRK